MLKKKRFISESSLKKRKRRFYIKVSLLFFCIIVFIWNLSFFLNHFLIIEEINIEGSKISNQKKIKEFSETILFKKYLFIFSANNKLIYPKNKLKSLLLKEFSEIKDLKMSIYKKENSKGLNISLIEKKPVALICQSENICSYADILGEIFAVAPEFSENVFVKFFIDDNSQRIFSFEEIINFIDGLKSVNIKAEKIIYQENNNYAVIGKRIDLKKEKDFDITLYFNEKYALNKIYENLSSVLFEYKDIYNIEYIDLRFGNNVVLKKNI